MLIIFFFAQFAFAGESCIRSEQPGESANVLASANGEAEHAAQELLAWADVNLDVADPEIASKLAEIVVSPDGQRIITLREAIDGHEAGEEMPLAVACCHVAWALKSEGMWAKFVDEIESRGGTIEVDELTEEEYEKKFMMDWQWHTMVKQESIIFIKDFYSLLEKYLRELIEIIDQVVDNDIRDPDKLKTYQHKIVDSVAWKEFNGKTRGADGKEPIAHEVIHCSAGLRLRLDKIERVCTLVPNIDLAELKQELVNDRIRITKLLEIFKRASEGLRTTPGVTFVITQPALEVKEQAVEVNAVGAHALGEAL